METNILAEEKPKNVKLADGKEYTLPPIDLTTLANVETTMGFGFNKFSTRMESETIGTLRLLIYALLKETYPDLTLDGVGRLITLKEMTSLSATISEIMVISS